MHGRFMDGIAIGVSLLSFFVFGLFAEIPPHSLRDEQDFTVLLDDDDDDGFEYFNSVLYLFSI